MGSGIRREPMRILTRVLSDGFRAAVSGWSIAAVAVVALLFGLGAGSPAAADDCLALGGVDGAECVISGLVGPKTGTFNLAKTLHFTGSGQLNVGAAGIVIDINPGDFVMEAGTLISGNGVNGAPIKVELFDGDIDLQTGSKIQSNGLAGGFIQLLTSGSHTADIDGVVESIGTNSGQGAVQAPGGGPITIRAGCKLTISDTGIVRSRGSDSGADLVHLEGCVVEVFGLVESTGPGHAVPNTPANSCSDAPSTGPRRNPLGGVLRVGKPQNSTGCVEIWAGTTLLIDSTSTHKGEVNADVGFTGGTQGRGWIDLLANGTITINDGAGNDRDFGAGSCTIHTTFAVHANGGLCQNTDDGGLILIQSYAGSVTASGHAIQADGQMDAATFPGGTGGEIRVEARNNVSIAGDIFARGDFVFPGFGTGGKIGPTTSSVPPGPNPTPIRAFSGALSWTSGTGDAQPTGAGVTPAQRGEINLQACAGINTVGAAFPTIGAPVVPYPAVLAAACAPAAPTVPPYVTGFPSGTCQTQCGLQPAGRKTGVKFNDLNQNGTQEAGELGLIGWKIHVFNTATKALVASTVTLPADPLATPPTPAGFYSFTLDPGSYTVCEEQQTGWQQTAPLPGSVPPPVGETLADCAPFAAASGLTLGPRGYNFTIVTTEIFQNNNFGNFQPPGACAKFATLVPTNTVVLNAADPHQIQKIIDAASTGDVILLMPQNAVKTESITINKKIQLIGCSITLNSDTVGAPVVTITSGANGGLTKDVHATGSTVAGYKIEGSSHTIANVRAFKNAIGFWITGNFNTVTGALGTLGNGTGVRIDGSNNVLDTNNGVQDSTGDGVVIGAGATLNTVKKYTVKGSGGNGFKVEALATLNTLSENKAYSNGLNGYLILGSDTKMSKNIAGDTGTGNAGDGIRVVGNNGDITENTSKSNTLVGIRVTGTVHKLTKNKSGGTGNQNNGSCQYVVGASNSNGGSNTTSNNATFTFTNAGANSPAGCVPAPPTP